MGRFLLALDGCKGRGRAKAGVCADMVLNSELWLKVVAESLGVTVEEAVCVTTDGATVSSRTEVLFKGEVTMELAEAIS